MGRKGRKGGGGGGGGGKRATTTATTFDSSQVQEFKEAFGVLDQNRDGFVDKEDLKDTYASFGKNPDDFREQIDKMIGEAAEPISFQVFLSLFGNKMKDTNPIEQLLNGMKQFDPKGKGFLPKLKVKEIFCERGDRFSEDEWNKMLAGAPWAVNKKGQFNWVGFLTYVRTGAEPEDDE